MPEFQLAPFFGAAALEVLHWYQLRERLSQVKYKRLLTSVGYWVITALAIVVGGIGSLLLLEGKNFSNGELMVAGAAFPTLLKKAVATFVKKRVTLGDAAAPEREEPSSIASDYLTA